MRHPLVEMACSKYYHKSHINEPLIIGKAISLEEKGFKENADKFVRNIEKYPHAFVLACLMDSGVDADAAWSIPYRACKELGTFEISDLYKIKEHQYIGMFSGEKKWHRYPIIKAKVFHDAVHKIVETKLMNGDASRIWADKPGSYDVVMRFIDFNGCGFKIANMASNILFRYFGVEFSDYSFIDIAPDVHTMRVFQRLGLTPYVKDTEIARIYTIVRARELNPEFPGLVDGLCWEVGREFCRPGKPKCENCPLGTFCEKVILEEINVWR
ncbi:MAG: Endonuclease III [Candidatus Dichloromethanomonas elyunquensis]|nr:MAG: Endonuclease III [Candidatus Dichloromethanomonas elyunquensis]